ncbi:YceI family protein [Calidithermus timidus]|jgi:polyisoprenoid-binding protein YceI|uniref:YceI family protein n=1 Tax=Calidithermus timidus TaxID=307124 RepID=UPI00037E8B2B|nr:YceI family protein [Calidithermus timidus]
MKRWKLEMRLVVLVWMLACGAVAQAPQSYSVEGKVTYFASYPLGRWQGVNPTARGVVLWREPEASGQVCVELSRFDSGNWLRDADTRGVFEIGQYPQSCFEASALRRLEGERVLLEGTLELHGVKKRIRIEGQLEADGAAYRFRGSFKTSFSEWNLQRPSLFFISVDDPLEVRLEARAEPVR